MKSNGSSHQTPIMLGAAPGIDERSILHCLKTDILLRWHPTQLGLNSAEMISELTKTMTHLGMAKEMLTTDSVNVDHSLQRSG